MKTMSPTPLDASAVLSPAPKACGCFRSA